MNMPQTHDMERPQSKETGGEHMEASRGNENEGGTTNAASQATSTGETRREDGRRRDNLTPEQRSAIGRKGGEAVSRNKEHMADIGRKGGVAVSRDREHMANIGQKGGRS
jgi:general stress protein YciG